MRVCKLIYYTKPHQMANTLKKKKKQSDGNEQPKTLINKMPERKHIEYTKEQIWVAVKRIIATY